MLDCGIRSPGREDRGDEGIVPRGKEHETLPHGVEEADSVRPDALGSKEIQEYGHLEARTETTGQLSALDKTPSPLRKRARQERTSLTPEMYPVSYPLRRRRGFSASSTD